MADILVSYRASDSQESSIYFSKTLAKRLGENVKIETLPDSTRSLKAIENKIRSSKLIFLVIGEDWAMARKADFNLCLEDPKDPIRLQIASAISEKKTIIPILLKTTEMPKHESLPSSIRAITNMKTLRLSAKDFDNELAQILAAGKEAGISGDKKQSKFWPAVGLVAGLLMICFLSFFALSYFINPVINPTETSVANAFSTEAIAVATEPSNTPGNTFTPIPTREPRPTIQRSPTPFASPLPILGISPSRNAPVNPTADSSENTASPIVISPTEGFSSTVISPENASSLQNIETLTQHGGRVSTLARSTDGLFMASGGVDGRVLYRNFAEGTLIHEFIMPQDIYGTELRSLAFDASGEWLAAGGLNSLIRVWDTGTFELVAELRLNFDGRSVERLVFNPVSRELAAFYSGGGNVVVWDVTSGTQRYASDENLAGTHDLVFSPDGSRLYIVGMLGDINIGFDSLILVLNTSDYQETHRYQTDTDVNHAYGATAISPDGSILYVLAPDGLRLFDANSLLETRFYSAWEQANIFRGKPQLVVSDNGRYAAYSQEATRLFIWDLQSENGTYRNYLISSGPSDTILDLEIDPYGETLLVAAASGQIYYVDSATLSHYALIDAHTSLVASIDFSPDGEHFYSAADSWAFVWDFDERLVQAAIYTNNADYPGIVAMPDNRSALVVGDYIHLWFNETNEMTVEIPSYRSTYEGTRAIAVSPDGRIGAFSTGFSFTVFSVSRQEIIQDNIEGYGQVYSLDFSPDGEMLAVGAGDALVLYDVDSLNPIKLSESLGSFSQLAFSPDGSRIAIVGDGPVLYEMLFFWDVDTGNVVRTVSMSGMGFAREVTYSPDGRLVAVYTQDNNAVTLWNSETGELAATLRGHTGLVLALAFSPDGRYLLSGGVDGIRIWGLPED